MLLTDDYFNIGELVLFEIVSKIGPHEGRAKIFLFSYSTAWQQIGVLGSKQEGVLWFVKDTCKWASALEITITYAGTIF